MLLSLILYIVAWSYLLTLMYRQQALSQKTVFLAAGAALLFHWITLYYNIIVGSGIQLNIPQAFSLVMASINLIVLLSCIKKPLHNLFILLFPLSTIAITIPLTLSSDNNTGSNVTLSLGLGTHVVLSLLAYSLLSIAALQALLLHWQSHRLKHHHTTGFIRLLPPLQTMEDLMFEVLWAGVFLLAAGIAVGGWYLENIFAQHLVHKTVLSLIALVIFATLLWGRSQRGWRGNRAIKWVLCGFCFLLLAYFGSKFVLEVILQKT